MHGSHETGSPYAPHTDDGRTAMLEAVGVETAADLFDIPAAVAFDDEFGIDARTERETRRLVRSVLERNDELTELLGRGHYGYYIPSLVDHLADRSEFLTSYTQYQPEVSQGFLQALFEYQSLLVELTGLEIANCSMYDAATHSVKRRRSPTASAIPAATACSSPTYCARDDGALSRTTSLAPTSKSRRTPQLTGTPISRRSRRSSTKKQS